MRLPMMQAVPVVQQAEPAEQWVVPVVQRVVSVVEQAGVGPEEAPVPLEGKVVVAAVRELSQAAEGRREQQESLPLSSVSSTRSVAPSCFPLPSP